MTKTRKPLNKRTDIIVIVPKQDELFWIGVAFGFEFGKPDRFLPFRQEPVYDRTITDNSGNEIRISFVGMDAQGNAESALITGESVRFLNPSLAFLVGTALGNPKRCKVGDVVFAEHVTDVSQTKAFDEGLPSWRATSHEPAGRMRRDVGRFRESVNLPTLQTTFFSVISTHLKDHHDQLLHIPGAVHLEAVAAGDILIASPTLAQDLWDYDDRLACYDMESGGFGRALGGHLSPDVPVDEDLDILSDTEIHGRRSLEWMVVRAISDFGDPESKRLVHNRQIASAIVGSVLLEFLRSGLKECHPYQLRPPTDRAAEIPRKHLYAKKNGTQYFRKRIQEDLNLELPTEQPLRSRTLGALAAFLHPLTDKSRSELLEYLNDVREAYFEDKYLGYTYEDDARSLLPGWALEFREIVRGILNMPRSGLEVLDVGVGNGLELEPLFGEQGVLAASVTGIDISAKMLEAAKQRFPALTTVHTSAEELRGIPARSVDLYVSLRTYMSRGFDVTRALEEAVRVLRPGGGIVLSIANGYVVEGQRGRQLVRGLTVSGTEAVDPQKPHEIAFQIQRQLYDFGFRSDGYISSQTDVYLWGHAPQAASRRARGLPETLVGQVSVRSSGKS